jgi:hypothetical protein
MLSHEPNTCLRNAATADYADGYCTLSVDGNQVFIIVLFCSVPSIYDLFRCLSLISINVKAKNHQPALRVSKRNMTRLFLPKGTSLSYLQQTELQWTYTILSLLGVLLCSGITSVSILVLLLAEHSVSRRI